MPYPVFISWSGPNSQKAASIVKEWIPDVLQDVTAFVSEDIVAGARWSNEIGSQLEKSGYGIICLTPDNLTAPWILFEAGALSKMVSSSFVTPILFGVDRSEVQFPLQQFQSVTLEKADLWRLFTSINGNIENSIEEARLKRIFDRSFEEYFHKISEVITKFTHHSRMATTPAPDSQTRALDEVLKVMQTIQVILSNPDALFPKRHIQTLIEDMQNSVRNSHVALDPLHPAWRDADRGLETMRLILGEMRPLGTLVDPRFEKLMNQVERVEISINYLRRRAVGQVPRARQSFYARRINSVAPKDDESNDQGSRE